MLHVPAVAPAVGVIYATLIVHLQHHWKLDLESHQLDNVLGVQHLLRTGEGCIQLRFVH